MKLRRVLGWTALAIPLVLVAAVFVGYWMSDNVCPAPETASDSTMSAVVLCDYGSADVLKVQHIRKPSPGDDEILVRVRDAALNPLDWHYMRGTPYVIRASAGLRKPAVTRIGTDFAGTVEAIGSKVSRFKPGDDVFGVRTGSFGEYVTIRESSGVALKPAGITFEQAASLPIAAVTALQTLRDRAAVKPGQKVLINGASGGVGTFAVQIAKSLGAEVTGVCSTRNLGLVRSLGADRVIDYSREDYTEGAERYDIIMDNVANHPLSANLHVLKSDGQYILIGGGGPDEQGWIGPLAGALKAFIMSPFVDQEIGMFLANVNREDLSTLGELVETGKVVPVIDRRYSLSEVPEAIRYLEKGHARGKVIITVREQ